MVDPDRKINHLTEDDTDFLEDSPDEFPNHFSNEDETCFASRPPGQPHSDDWGVPDRSSSEHLDNGFSESGRRQPNSNYNRNRRSNHHDNKIVDTDHKINQMSEEDKEFLEECLEEFANRFSKEDETFTSYVNRPLAPPPLDDWGVPERSSSEHFDNGSGRRPYNSNYNRHRRNNYHDGGHWNNRRDNNSHRYNNREYRNHNRNHPYQRRYNDDGNSNQSNFHHSGLEPSRDDKDYKPIEIKRDYSNFVPATEKK